MAAELPSSATILQRMVDAVEQVRKRLLRTSAALRQAGVPYAVAGGNAVAAWVATVDEGAVRNTQDVDVLVRREDFARVKAAMEGAGFVHRHAAGLDVFLDHPRASARQGVHLVFANELVRPGEPAVNPDVSESAALGDIQVLKLDALVRVKLTAFTDKDRTRLRDLLEVGMIDAAWVARLPAVLGQRLQSLIDTPDG